MTIGIAAAGPRAGLGIFHALRAVERVGRGAIGGFVSLAVLTSDGEILRASTQTGGTTTLFGGDGPPLEIAEARLAVLMSSGPNRPEPLAQFTPVRPDVALITGHRLPNVVAVGATPPNEMLLDAIETGLSAQAAVRQVLQANADADAGVIALTPAGEIALGDTALVERRGDRGGLLFSDEQAGVTGGVLHNSIFPVRGITEIVAGMIIDTAREPDRADFMMTVDTNTKVVCGAASAVSLGQDLHAERIVVEPNQMRDGYLEGALFFLGTPVYGPGEALLGHVSGEEPYTIVSGERIVSLSGRPSARIGVRAGERSAR
ncbi:hypothetical protein [Oricola sp.]|uniref:DUF6963 family protein n=1 Tax=Oricola sp. TaxID=1979950 RepID=UPI0025FF16FF|nr:hypothetical protein [Oricola sp.]MCI5074056.1 hypothetical protein [Oricola sp.]